SRVIFASDDADLLDAQLAEEAFAFLIHLTDVVGVGIAHSGRRRVHFGKLAGFGVDEGDDPRIDELVVAWFADADRSDIETPRCDARLCLVRGREKIRYQEDHGATAMRAAQEAKRAADVGTARYGTRAEDLPHHPAHMHWPVRCRDVLLGPRGEEQQTCAI